jgi:hypothetical protein
MADDETTGRALEALSPFLAAALRARGPAEIAAGSKSETMSVEVRIADVRRALSIYEKDLGGDQLVEWISDGRAARSRSAPENGAAGYMLEVAPANGGAPESYECADLDQVRDRVEAAAAASADAMRELLGDADASPEELAAQLGRQAFRRLASQIRSQPGPARFDLPDRPWLRLTPVEAD